MSRQEVQGHAQPETTALDGRREARHHRRSASDSADDQRGVPATRYFCGSALCLGEASAEWHLESAAGRARSRKRANRDTELETEVTQTTQQALDRLRRNPWLRGLPIVDRENPRSSTTVAVSSSAASGAPSWKERD
jgi:hypothetical protein